MLLIETAKTIYIYHMISLNYIADKSFFWLTISEFALCRSHYYILKLKREKDTVSALKDVIH